MKSLEGNNEKAQIKEPRYTIVHIAPSIKILKTDKTRELKATAETR